MVSIIRSSYKSIRVNLSSDYIFPVPKGHLKGLNYRLCSRYIAIGILVHQ